MNLTDLTMYSKRGSGRTIRMLKGVIADAPNKITIIGANTHSVHELKKAYVALGGNLSLVRFKTIDDDMYGIGAFAIDHYALEILQQRYYTELTKEKE